jgi:hypothetical protein
VELTADVTTTLVRRIKAQLGSCVSWSPPIFSTPTGPAAAARHWGSFAVTAFD